MTFGTKNKIQNRRNQASRRSKIIALQFLRKEILRCQRKFPIFFMLLCCAFFLFFFLGGASDKINWDQFWYGKAHQSWERDFAIVFNWSIASLFRLKSFWIFRKCEFFLFFINHEMRGGMSIDVLAQSSSIQFKAEGSKKKRKEEKKTEKRFCILDCVWFWHRVWDSMAHKMWLTARKPIMHSKLILWK